MVYTATHFRKNMGEILDDIRFNRKIEFIGRRKRKEFVLIPYEMWEEQNYEKMFDEAIIEAMNKVESDGTLDKLDNAINKLEVQGKL